jgi:hypothetical protein
MHGVIDRQTARKNEIARRYLRPKKFELDRHRIRELSTLARHRHPDGRGDFVLRETPLGKTLAIALITHHHHQRNRAQWLFQFCRDRAPWLDPDEIEIGRLLPHKADELGRLLHLTSAERDTLKIRTIAPCDQTRAQRQALRKAKKRERDRERQRLKRKVAGAVTREQYLAKSRSRLKPWVPQGISRAKWYRQAAARETG